MHRRLPLWLIALSSFSGVGCCLFLCEAPLQHPASITTLVKKRGADSCQGGLSARKKEYKQLRQAPSADQRTLALASQMAACGQWDALLAWLLPLHLTPGTSTPQVTQERPDILLYLQQRGVDVIHQIKAWLASNGHWKQTIHKPKTLVPWRSHRRDVHMARYLFQWIQRQTQAYDLCPVVHNGYPTWTSPIKRQALVFLSEMRCPGWHRRLRQALSHPNPHNRSLACQLLAMHGNNRDLVSITQLATSDTASFQRGASIEFPVRRACLEARMQLLRRPLSRDYGIREPQDAQ